MSQQYNLLITGAISLSSEEKQELSLMGYNLYFLQNEKSELTDIKYEDIDVVICNALFMYHPIEKFTSLKVIQLTSAGLDRVRVEYIKSHNIKLFNAGDTYSIPMSEYAICGVLDIYKQKRYYFINQEKHLWEKNKDILELNNKTVTILGCGNVGKQCAYRFKAFNCFVIGVDINKVSSPFDKYVDISSLDEVLPLTDVLVLSLPLTKETEHLIDKEKLSKLKKSAVIVNISRGKIIDQDALIDALKSNSLLGAVLDVFEEEPLSKDSPLWDMKNVIVTPHISYCGENNKDRLFEKIKINLKND